MGKVDDEILIAVPSEQDGSDLIELSDLGDVLLSGKPLMPDKKLDILERMIGTNWKMAAAARVRMEWIIEYIRRTELWKCRIVQNEHGEAVQEFKTFSDYVRALFEQFSTVSTRTIEYRTNGVRFVQSIGVGVNDSVPLLEDPSKIHTVTKLFETDTMGRFVGFAKQGVEESLREMLGDEGEMTADEVARESTKMIITSAPSVAKVVDDILRDGELRHRFIFKDKGTLIFVVWRVGGKERHEATFVLDGELDGVLRKELKRYYPR